MKVYESKDIRNVGLVGHGDSGKTSLTAGLLFTAGASNRLLRVDEGNTITDFDDEEIARRITISTAVAVAEWKKAKINILDTPGYNIFIQDAKSALVAFTRAVAADWAARGVTVNAIAPGGFLTDANRRWFRERPEFQKEFEANIPMGRLGEPEEVAPLAVYLASEASRYMTGAVVVIDGGYTLW